MKAGQCSLCTVSGLATAVHSSKVGVPKGDVYIPLPVLLTLAVELHPGDVVPHTLHGPPRQRGLHHGQVGLPTGAGERRRHVALHSLRVGDAQDLQREERPVSS